jgi:hypothetical protein
MPRIKAAYERRKENKNTNLDDDRQAKKRRQE